MGKYKRYQDTNYRLDSLTIILWKIKVLSLLEIESTTSKLYLSFGLFETMFRGKKEAKIKARSEVQRRNMMWRAEFY